MRSSPRSKVNILLSLLSGIVIVSAFLISAVFLRGAATHASGPQQYSATKGMITQVGAADPAQSSANALPKGARHTHQANNTAANARQVTASSSPLDEGQVGKLLHNFNGVSSRDSAVTNFGAEFEPPDQGLCVGNGFVLEAVNSAYTIYRPNGAVVAGPFNVNVLFHEGLKQFTSDPRCYYDKSTNTWFAIIVFLNSTNTGSHIDIAVNPSGDPTTPWTVYHINTTDSDGASQGCPCFGDQPLLGIDQQNLYVSTNEFSIVGPQFNGAQIYAISKSELVALTSWVHFVHFEDLSIGGALATSVQPAITNGPADAEYFMNSLDPFGTFDNRLGVWALTDREAVSGGGIPNLSSVVITSEPYGVPPKAIQKGSSSLLDSGDDRMQQVQFINGTLWGALGTAVTIPNDTASRAGAAWFQVRPHLNGEVVGEATITKQGYVAKLGNYLLYPAIQASPEGTAAIVMTLSGPNFYPSAVYTFLREGQTAFGPIHIVAHGTGPYDPTATRWGDYSWAILSSSGDGFWMATEYIPPRSSQTVDQRRNWGTRVFEVSAGD
jgi:hypothetical protein